MSWSHVANRGTNNSKTTGTTIGVSPSATISAGQVLFVTWVGSNVGTSQGYTTAVSVADDVSGGNNTYTRCAEYTRTDGSSGDGVTIALFRCEVTDAIGTGDTITATSTSIPARAIGLEEFDGNGVQQVYTNAANGNGTSIESTISGLTSKEYLFFGLGGWERYVSDFTSGDTDYTDLTTIGTSGGGPASNNAAHPEYRIYTGTGDTHTVTISNSTDWASLIMAIEESAAATPVSDSTPAFLKGQDTASDSVPAYLAGKDSASDAQSAWLRGFEFPWTDGFESGDISAWDADQGSPSVTTDAAMVGTYGLEPSVTNHDYIAKYVTTTDLVRARFRLNTNDATGSTDDRIQILRIIDSGVVEGGLLELYYSGGIKMRVGIRQDDNTWHFSTLATISTGTELLVDVLWHFQDTNGYVKYWIDGVEQSGVSNIDTGTRTCSLIRFGVTTFHAFDSGTIYLDDFTIYDTGIDIGSQPAYLKGRVSTSDSTPAYLEGTGGTISDNTPAYLKGKNTAQDSQPAYLKGSLSTSGSKSAYLAGQDTATDIIPAFLKGQDTTSDNTPAFLQGALGASDTVPAYLKGQDTASDSTSAYLIGSTSISDSQSAFLDGKNTAIDTIPAFLKGKDTASDSSTAYLAGIQGASDNIPAYTKGQDTASDSQSAYLAGGINVSDNIPAYIEGAGTPVSDDTPAYLAGKSSTSGSTSAYLAGGIQVSDTQVAYLKGQNTATDDAPAYLKGQDTASDSKSAYLTGATGISDSSPAFLKGQDTASDSTSAYILGGIASSIPAYLEGLGTATSDSIPAYLKGGIAVSSSISAYIEAYLRSDIPVFLSGVEFVASTRPAYLEGDATAASDSQPAFLAGSQKTVPAYLEGINYVRSRTHAYMKGVKHINWNFGRVWMTGGIKPTPSTIPAYLHGGVAVSDSTPAFLKGIMVDARSSIHAYIGAPVYRSSISAFLEGLMTEYNYIILENSNASLSVKYRVVAQGYDDGSLDKSASIKKTIGGGVDVSMGETYTTWNPIIRARHTEPVSGYGTVGNLETLYKLNDPGGTPSNVITFTDNHGVGHSVYMLGDFKKNYIGAHIEGDQAWVFVKLALVEKA